MVDVQRSALGEGGESLNVEPQVYGGRKMLVLFDTYNNKNRNDIWSTHILIDVDTLSSISYRVAFIRKYKGPSNSKRSMDSRS